MTLQSDRGSVIHDPRKTLIELPRAMKIAREGLHSYFATLALGEMPNPARSILFLEEYLARRRIVVRSGLPEGVCPEDPDDYLAGHRALALLVILQGQEAFARWMIEWTKTIETISAPGAALYVFGGIGTPRNGTKPPFRPFYRYLVDVEHETRYRNLRSHDSPSEASELSRSPGRSAVTVDSSVDNGRRVTARDVPFVEGAPS
jgi:hypothetical protein